MYASTRKEVFDALTQERIYQFNKWGEVNENHEISAWIVFMEHYLTEARTAATGGKRRDVVSAIRKVTALGVACLENHGAVTRAEEMAS